jgi:hypothetical protein
MSDEKQDDKNCVQCGKPGGRRRVDPYVLELEGKREVVRLHDRCVQERYDDI